MLCFYMDSRCALTPSRTSNVITAWRPRGSCTSCANLRIYHLRVSPHPEQLTAPCMFPWDASLPNRLPTPLSSLRRPILMTPSLRLFHPSPRENHPKNRHPDLTGQNFRLFRKAYPGRHLRYISMVQGGGTGRPPKENRPGNHYPSPVAQTLRLPRALCPGQLLWIHTTQDIGTHGRPHPRSGAVITLAWTWMFEQAQGRSPDERPRAETTPDRFFRRCGRCFRSASGMPSDSEKFTNNHEMNRL
jgi:hypothetical protein